MTDLIHALLALALLATIVTSRKAPIAGVAPTGTPNNPYSVQPFCVGGVSHVAWSAGWNLIDGGAALIATNFPGAVVYGRDGGRFAALDPRAAVPGMGYWFLSPEPFSVAASGGGGIVGFVPCPPKPVTLAAGKWALVGNPASQQMALHGADAAFVYDGGGYRATTVLGVGQAAWVWSAHGGTLTFTRATDP